MGDSPHRSADAGTGGIARDAPSRTGPPVPAYRPRHPSAPAPPAPAPGSGGGGALPRRRRFGAETVFRGLSTGAGAMVLVIIVAIAIFLIAKAVPALRANTENFLTYEGWFPNDSRAEVRHRARSPSAPSSARRSHCSSRCRSRWASRCACRTTRPGGWPPRSASSIDLLAAVPSVVFGLWGRDYFVEPVKRLLGLAAPLRRLAADLRQ